MIGTDDGVSRFCVKFDVFLLERNAYLAQIQMPIWRRFIKSTSCSRLRIQFVDYVKQRGKLNLIETQIGIIVVGESTSLLLILLLNRTIQELDTAIYLNPRCLWKPHEAESVCKFTQISGL